MQFTVNHAGEAALGAKRRPIKKIERDYDKVLGGCRFLFLSNNQPKDGVRDGGAVLGRVRACGRMHGGSIYRRLGRWHK